MFKDIDPEDHKRDGRLISPVLIIAMTNFIDMTGFGMIILLLPFYATIFQEGAAALGILVSSFSLMQFIFSPVLGRISDRIGRKPVLLLSILTSTVSFILFALASSFLLLLISRIMAGMATETAVAQAYVADVTSKEERASGMGKVSAAQAAGFLVGPALGGVLSIYGFWAPGLAAAALAFLNLAFVFFFLPESNTAASNRCPDIQMPSMSNDQRLRKFADAMRKPLIGSLLTVSFITSLAFSAIPVVLPLLGISLFELGTLEMAGFFIYIGLVQIAFQGFIIGGVVRKFGEWKLITFASLLMMFGMFFISLVTNIAVLLVLVAMTVFGSDTIQTVVPSSVSKRTTPSEQGSMLGAVQSVSSIARVPGPLIGGLAYEFSGVAAPFLLCGTLLMFASALGIRVHFELKQDYSRNQREQDQAMSQHFDLTNRIGRRTFHGLA